MRAEWVPLSAAALVTGVMALVLGQMLNPAGSETSPARQMLVAGESPGRWLAMSILYFGGAAALVLGVPAIMTLFEDRRGRGVGMTGVVVFTIGCVGVGGLAAMMLMFRALALEALKQGRFEGGEISLVTQSLDDPGLAITLSIWVYGFVAGVLLISIGLFRAKGVPGWVPGLLIAFVAVQAVLPVLGQGTGARVASALGLLLLAAGLTGIATNAASPRSPVPVTHSLVRN
jgi:hypothetical protein